MIVTAAMPVVNAKARAKTKAIFFMTRAPLSPPATCQRWVKTSVTAVTFWGFSYLQRRAVGSGATQPSGLFVFPDVFDCLDCLL